MKISVYEDALNDIRRAKEGIEGMTFEEAGKYLAGFNCDGTLFDFDLGRITGTVDNVNGMAKISPNCHYEVWGDYEGTDEPDPIFSGTEQELLERSKLK